MAASTVAPFASAFEVSVVNVRNWFEGPYNVYNDNIEKKAEHSVIGEGDFQGMISPLVQTKEGMLQYQDENKIYKRTLRSVQLSREACRLRECKRILENHYQNITGYNPEIVETEFWTSYCPRWSPSEVKSVDIFCT